MPGLGEEFRAAREARGLSLSDVAEQIHIRSIYLQAIESEDWATIGPAVYVRGFIRTYARFLGLDGEAAVALFAQATPGAGAASPGTASPDPATARIATAVAPRRGPSVWLWLSGVVALVLIGFVGYNYYLLQSGDRVPQSGSLAQASASPAPSQDTSSAGAPAAAQPSAVAEPAATTPAGSPVPAPPVPRKPRPLPSGPTLTMRVTSPSWVRVVVDGNVAVEGVYPAGTLKSFHGKQAVVRIGNAGGVDVVINGHDLGKLGASGDVVERTFPLQRE